ncbi:MAG TPA: SRPBCC family protein [Chitinophagaceae bacterium]|nr:SRPBCC family protein [Chitinophagaceae bacterium]
MRFIKLGLISIVIITIVLLAISFALPSHVRISRAINIDAPADSVMPHLKNLDQWAAWNEVIKDSTLKAIKFSSDQIQTERITIYPVASVKQNWTGTRWVQPDGREFESAFDLIRINNYTVTQWYFDFYFKWYRPWEKFASIIYDKQMGPSMEKSLTQLKALVESSH